MLLKTKLVKKLTVGYPNMRPQIDLGASVVCEYLLILIMVSVNIACRKCR